MEVKKWLSPITPRTVNNMIKKYTHSFLIEEIEKAFVWHTESGATKKVGGFLSGWLSRSNDPNKLIDNETEAAIVRLMEAAK